MSKAQCHRQSESPARHDHSTSDVRLWPGITVIISAAIVLTAAAKRR
ncbi:unnamed protein product [Rhodiola kirilowii]